MEFDLGLRVGIANVIRFSLYLLFINPLAMRATQALVNRATSKALERDDVVRAVVSGWRKLLRVWLPDVSPFSISGRYTKYVVAQLVLAVAVKALEALAEFGFDSRQVPTMDTVVRPRYGYVGDMDYGPADERMFAERFILSKLAFECSTVSGETWTFWHLHIANGLPACSPTKREVDKPEVVVARGWCYSGFDVLERDCGKDFLRKYPDLIRVNEARNILFDQSFKYQNGLNLLFSKPEPRHFPKPAWKFQDRGEKSDFGWIDIRVHIEAVWFTDQTSDEGRKNFTRLEPGTRTLKGRIFPEGRLSDENRNKTKLEIPDTAGTLEVQMPDGVYMTGISAAGTNGAPKGAQFVSGTQGGEKYFAAPLDRRWLFKPKHELTNYHRIVFADMSSRLWEQENRGDGVFSRSKEMWSLLAGVEILSQRKLRADVRNDISQEATYKSETGFTSTATINLYGMLSLGLAFVIPLVVLMYLGMVGKKSGFRVRFKTDVDGILMRWADSELGLGNSLDPVAIPSFRIGVREVGSGYHLGVLSEDDTDNVEHLDVAQGV